MSTTPSTEQQETVDKAELLDLVTKLIEDPKGRQAFVRMLKKSKEEKIRPSHWSKAANSPYYRHRFAEEIKIVVDEVLLSKKPKIWLFKEFEGKLSRKSLYLKINQAFLYLVEEMDDEAGTYKTAKENITITRENTGIQMAIAAHTESLTTPSDASSINKSLDWKVKLDKFLEEGAVNVKFEITKLNLSDEDVTNTTSALTALGGNVAFIVKNDSIKVVKLPPPVATQSK